MESASFRSVIHFSIFTKETRRFMEERFGSHTCFHGLSHIRILPIYPIVSPRVPRTMAMVKPRNRFVASPWMMKMMAEIKNRAVNVAFAGNDGRYLYHEREMSHIAKVHNSLSKTCSRAAMDVIAGIVLVILKETVYVYTLNTMLIAFRWLFF